MSRKKTAPRLANTSTFVKAVTRIHVLMTATTGSSADTWLPMRMPAPGATCSCPVTVTFQRTRKTRSSAIVTQ